MFKNCQTNSELWRKIGELGVLKDKTSTSIGISADRFCDHFAVVQSERPGQRTETLLDEPINPFVFQCVDDEDISTAVYRI